MTGLNLNMDRTAYPRVERSRPKQLITVFKQSYPFRAVQCGGSTTFYEEDDVY
jgi:hypothetical protein